MEGKCQKNFIHSLLRVFNFFFLMRTVLAKVLHAFHHIEIVYFFFLILKFSTTKIISRDVFEAKKKSAFLIIYTNTNAH